MGWLDYMDEIAGKDASTHEIADIIGDDTSASTVRRWRNGVKPSADKVIAFGRGYHQNPVVGLVEGGYISADEVRTFQYSARTTEELLTEIQTLNDLPSDVKAKLDIPGRVADIKAEIERRTRPAPKRPRRKTKQAEAHGAPSEDETSSTER